MPGGETVEDGKISRKAFEKTSGAGVPTRRLTATSVLLFAATICSGCTQRVPIATELTSPLRITANRTTPRQTIHVLNPSDEGAIVIEQDGVVLDLGRSELIGAAEHTPPDEYVGRGIVVRNARNVTIRNAIICEFKVAIYSENAPGLTIDHCDVSRNYRQRLKSTPLREHPDDWLFGHENDQNEWLRYGAGIYLLRCDGAKVFNCRARDGQNGICLVRTNNALVESNDIAFMSGWGLAMWRSSFCRVIGNRFDYCVRGYSHGVYARGQDSTGILVYEQCSDNVFAYNSATHGGDGFFLYAGNETVKKTGTGGCNRNLVYGNDFSHAVANAIEATFSADNRFWANRLSHSTHGVWAGYSRDTEIAMSEIADCDAGVSIEHGIANRIVGNRFEDCRTGVHLWWDDDADLLASACGRRWGGASADEHLRGNRFTNCATAIRVTDSRGVGLVGNIFDSCERVLALVGHNEAPNFSNNVVYRGRIENDGPIGLQGAGNYLAPAVRSIGLVELSSPASKEAAGSAVNGIWFEAIKDNPVPERDGWVERTFMNSESVGFLPVAPPLPPAPLPGVPPGKECIFIDEWGPCDLRSPRLIPTHTVAWNKAVIHVLGRDQSFKVIRSSGRVDLTPTSGTTPVTVAILLDEEADSAEPFTIGFDLAGRLVEARGTMLRATWRIDYFAWSDDCDPRGGDESWQRVVSAEPLRGETINHLDLVWGGAGPEGLPSGDRFAVVATTTMRLRPGRWRIRTISDDGIRVYVDENRVIDNWTWHVPTEDVAEFDSPGAVHALRVEYFEIDGHAQLQLFLEPALAREHGLSLIRTSSEAASSSHRD